LSKYSLVAIRKMWKSRRSNYEAKRTSERTPNSIKQTSYSYVTSTQLISEPLRSRNKLSFNLQILRLPNSSLSYLWNWIAHECSKFLRSNFFISKGYVGHVAHQSFHYSHLRFHYHDRKVARCTHPRRPSFPFLLVSRRANG